MYEPQRHANYKNIMDFHKIIVNNVAQFTAYLDNANN